MHSDWTLWKGSAEIMQEFLERLHPAMNSAVVAPWWENSDGLGIFRACAS